MADLKEFFGIVGPVVMIATLVASHILLRARLDRIDKTLGNGERGLVHKVSGIDRRVTVIETIAEVENG